jgi:hypothetical protein
MTEEVPDYYSDFQPAMTRSSSTMCESAWAWADISSLAEALSSAAAAVPCVT